MMTEYLSSEAALIIVLALVAGGFVKGITGMGLPSVAIPVMASFLGVERAVVIMVIPVIVLNGWLVWRYRACAGQVPEMPRLLLAGCFGAPLGAWFLYSASERVLSTLLAAWIGVYLLLRFLHPSFSLSLRSRYRVAPIAGFCAGAFQAATGISAPVIATYSHALQLGSTAYIYAVTAPFMVMAVVHFVALVSFRVYTPRMLLESLLALIPALLVIPLGVYVGEKIKRRAFDNLVVIILVVMGLKLLYNAWWGA